MNNKENFPSFFPPLGTQNVNIAIVSKSLTSWPHLNLVITKIAPAPKSYRRAFCSQTRTFCPSRLCAQVLPLQFFNYIQTTLICNSCLFFLSQQSMVEHCNHILKKILNCHVSSSLYSTYPAKPQILIIQLRNQIILFPCSST